MPSPKQTQLLLALEAGHKLHEALREPGMPSKALLQEWLDNPEFDRLYTEATEKGTAKRLKKLGQPAPGAAPAHRPAVLREVPLPVAEQNTALSLRLTEIIGDGESYNAPLSPLAAGPAGPAGPPAFVPNEMQEQVLRRLRAGESPTKLVQGGLAGYNATKLAAWRKEPAFVLLYDEARRIGSGAHLTPEPAAVAPPEPVAEEPAALSATVEPVAPYRTLGAEWNTFSGETALLVQQGAITMADHIALNACSNIQTARQHLEQLLSKQPAPEPAPNQSEPAPAPEGPIEQETSLPACLNEGAEQQGTSATEPRYATVVQVSDWLSLEEAKELARTRAGHLNKSVFVVERVCVAEHVVQILP